jgi:hypothetical protein
VNSIQGQLETRMRLANKAFPNHCLDGAKCRASEGRCDVRLIVHCAFIGMGA